MKDYRDALSRFMATDLGGETAGADEVLRQDVHEVMRSDTKYFNLCIAILVVLFLGAVATVLCNLNHPTTITAIFSATGVSFAFLLNKIIGLWREKTHAEVAYNLALRLPPQDLKAVISILLTQGK